MSEMWIANILQRQRRGAHRRITVVLSVVHGQAFLHCCDDMAQHSAFGFWTIFPNSCPLLSWIACSLSARLMSLMSL